MVSIVIALATMFHLLARVILTKPLHYEESVFVRMGILIHAGLYSLPIRRNRADR